MFKKRTLFVLGAGASHEFDLPLGPTLAAKIAEKMNVRFRYGAVADAADIDLMELLFSRVGSEEVNQYVRASGLIQHGVQLCSSIDDFLDVHAADMQTQRVGKMAIVKTVLQAERASRLYFDKSNIYNRMSVRDFENTWIVKFIRMLNRGLRIDKKRRAV